MLENQDCCLEQQRSYGIMSQEYCTTNWGGCQGGWGYFQIWVCRSVKSRGRGGACSSRNPQKHKITKAFLCGGRGKPLPYPISKQTDKLQFAYYIPSTFPQRTKREAMTTSLFLMRYKLYQYIPPIPPPMPPAAGASTLGSGLSATTDSVVRMTDAMEEAFCRAERVTLVGSTIPAAIMST